MKNMHQDPTNCKPVRVITHRAKAMPWYKRCPADWQRGTRRHAMSFELRGFYSECLDIQWELQAELPKDPKTLALLLGTNARMIRALMPQLLALGKMVETASGYLNPRMFQDITGTAFDLGSVVTRAPVALDSLPKIGKKPAITTRDLERRKEEEDKERRESKPALVSTHTREKESGLASLSAPLEDKHEDAASEMAVSIMAWCQGYPGNGMNEFEARNWLRTTVRTYGQRTVAEAYQKLKTDLATGAIIGHPLRAWSGIASRINDDAAAKAEAKTKPKPKSDFAKLLEKRLAIANANGGKSISHG